MNEEKKPLSNSAKVAVGIAAVLLIITTYFIGHTIGYNKGFDKGVGWQ